MPSVVRDIRTNIGKNLVHIRKETGLKPWIFCSQRLQKVLRQNTTIGQVAVEDAWRITYLDKLSTVRTDKFSQGRDVENYHDVNFLTR